MKSASSVLIWSTRCSAFLFSHCKDHNPDNDHQVLINGSVMESTKEGTDQTRKLVSNIDGSYNLFLISKCF